METVFVELNKLIDHVDLLQAQLSAVWLQGAYPHVNLKKRHVRQIEPDNDIHRSILAYVQLLNEWSIRFMPGLSEVCAFPVSARVKAPNSIESKINTYQKVRPEQGGSPINKCLNDLMGVRIMIPTPLDPEALMTHIQAAYPRHKCIDSSKGEYKAVHLYFAHSNQEYPWELQIWSQQDREQNFASHKKYKQAYTTWEKESKEGGILDG